MPIRTPDGEASLRILELLQELSRVKLLGAYLQQISNVINRINTNPQLAAEQQKAVLAVLTDFEIVQQELLRQAKNEQKPESEEQEKAIVSQPITTESYITFLCAIWSARLTTEYIDHFQQLAKKTGVNLKKLAEFSRIGLAQVHLSHQ